MFHMFFHKHYKQYFSLMKNKQTLISDYPKIAVVG